MPPSAPEPDEPQEPWVPVGVDEIAVRLGVTRGTVSTWRNRSRTWKQVEPFPAPQGKLSGRDWWWWKRVEDWASRAGRLLAEGAEPPGRPYRPKRAR